ncbi:Zn(2)-C6 fungal-type domain-containing protein [Mycena sanguinolenta]|uniref:Zn(2)-C6 fungal-type domain-containing protein n=1 Tax=Mycena sanguinolenta TaxID=230812 RepID=A0A8H6Y2J5_9AGAR|nr:Zn(2)-C6 fungal-type domain-containing protein [Mycena sanguinolenta]
MSSDDEQTIPAKKRRIQRACDACRRKKRTGCCVYFSSVGTELWLLSAFAGDGLRMSEKKCTNCIENGLVCTFEGAHVKRRSYVDALEARLELTEKLLRKEGSAPAPSASSSVTSAGNSSQWSSDSPIHTHESDISTASGGTGPGVMLAALNMRSMNTPAPAPHGDDLAHLELIQDLSNLSITQVRDRFQGKSSGAMLVKTAVQLREGYEQKDIPWASRRMHYWTFNPVKHRVPHEGPYIFPDPDLLSALVDLYFAHKNLYFPVLHRPTFERSIADRLHTRDTTFGAVVLLVCAIGSRFSDDARLSPPGAEPLRRGWQFFDQLPLRLDHLFETPTLYDLQYYCLATSFLENSAPAACWTLIGIGIRLAQDVGAHRRRDGTPTVETELWKRGFWVLVSYDRQVSMSLGRSCATQHEDIDADLPIECDDEFWENDDPALAFVQPAGKPSRTTFFNCYLRLNNVLAFGLKMLYSLNKTKRLLAYRDQAWEEHLVAEMDSALNGWVDGIPPHLRWDPNRRDEAFFDQSALLYCSYYQVQVMIHRPFIPAIRQGTETSLPSLAICTNAARSCSHVADMSRLRKNGVPVPVLISSVFTSGVVLLLNIWSGKRTGLPPQFNSAITEVHKCMATLRVCEKMCVADCGPFFSKCFAWISRSSEVNCAIISDLLHELATIGKVPLTKDGVTPSGVSNPSKRAREENQEPSQDARTAAPVQHPPTHNVYHPPHPNPTTSALPPQIATPQLAFGSSFGFGFGLGDPLPTYTTELGKLPVFHSHSNQRRASPDPTTQSTSTWYPAQPAAPLGRPNFTVSGGGGGGASLPNGGSGLGGNASDSTGISADAFGVNIDAAPLFASALDTDVYAGTLNAGGINEMSDVMEMWANAPASFEVDDWGAYLSAMSELTQDLEGSAP